MLYPVFLAARRNRPRNQHPLHQKSVLQNPRVFRTLLNRCSIHSEILNPRDFLSFINSSFDISRKRGFRAVPITNLSSLNLCFSRPLVESFELVQCPDQPKALATPAMANVVRRIGFKYLANPSSGAVISEEIDSLPWNLTTASSLPTTFTGWIAGTILYVDNQSFHTRRPDGTRAHLKHLKGYQGFPIAFRYVPVPEWFRCHFHTNFWLRRIN